MFILFTAALYGESAGYIWQLKIRVFDLAIEHQISSVDYTFFVDYWLNGHPSTADTHDITDNSEYPRLSFHSLQYVSNSWIGTPHYSVYGITNSFRGPANNTLYNNPNLADTSGTFQQTCPVVNNLTLAWSRSTTPTENIPEAHEFRAIRDNGCFPMVSV